MFMHVDSLHVCVFTYLWLTGPELSSLCPVSMSILIKSLFHLTDTRRIHNFTAQFVPLINTTIGETILLNPLNTRTRVLRPHGARSMYEDAYTESWLSSAGMVWYFSRVRCDIFQNVGRIWYDRLPSFYYYYIIIILLFDTIIKEGTKTEGTMRPASNSFIISTYRNQ